ncbi:hypothetical protein ACEPAI_9683 [Sanghuangporus weigelae]
MNGTCSLREPEDYVGPLEMSFYQRLKAQLPEVTSSEIGSVSLVLTLASLVVSSKEDDEVLVFSREISSSLRLGPCTSDDSSPIVAFFAPRAAAEQLASGDHIGANSNIDIPTPSLHLLVSIIVAKGSSNDVDQCMRYLLSLSSYRPASYEQHGLVVCKKDFTIVSVGLEYRRTWSRVPWNHPSAIQKLCTYVKLIRDEAVRPYHPAVPKLKEVITMKTRTIGLYSAISAGRRFRLLPILSRGDGRKPFVALGVTEDDQVDEWKVRVALADFDHATIIHTGEEDDLMVKTGTPMFMAEDVLSVRDGSIMTTFSRFSENVRREVPNDCVDKYSDCQEKHEWDKFYENFVELRWRIEPTLNNDDKLVQSFRHGAVHDAESVFYLCLLFFGRLWPFDEHVDPSEIPTLEANRGKLFEIFAGRRCDNTVCFVFPGRASFGTGEKFEPIYAMLKTMFSYIKIPWYNVVATGRGERYEFHLHDFMQRLILKEIRRLRANGDPIFIEENPLPVKPSYNLATYFHDAYLSSSLLCSRDELNGRIGYKKDASAAYSRRECSRSRGIFTARARRTREGKEGDTRNRKRRRNRNNLVNSSSPNTLVLPVDRPKEMPESDKEKFHDPTGTFWDIYWWKAREKLWVTCGR